jgi:hypothetical protein
MMRAARVTGVSSGLTDASVTYDDDSYARAYRAQEHICDVGVPAIDWKLSDLNGRQRCSRDQPGPADPNARPEYQLPKGSYRNAQEHIANALPKVQA